MGVKIIFHCGISKTGTSALQNYFSINRDFLRQNGCHYPVGDYENTGVGSGNGEYLCRMAESGVNSDTAVRCCAWIDTHVHNASKLNCGHLIISSETFSTIPKRALSDLVSLFVDRYPASRFVVYERDRYKWYFSSWMQSIKADANSAWIDENLVVDPDYSLHPLRTYDEIRKITSNVARINYDQNRENLLDSFFVGADIRGFELNAAPQMVSDVNLSLSREELFLLLFMNKSTNGDVSILRGLNRLICVGALEPYFFVDRTVLDVIRHYCALHRLDCLGEDQWDCHQHTTFDAEYRCLGATFQKALAFQAALVEVLRRVYDLKVGDALEKIAFYRNSPHQSDVPSDFNCFEYLILNSDVLAADCDPYGHYVSYGKRENRRYLVSRLLDDIGR